jgi:hypothetical protein
MSLLDERRKTADAIAKGTFVAHVLGEEARELDKDIKGRMNSFSSSFWNQRNLAVQNTTLTYTTLLQHRFADMKTRQTATGVIKKERHKIHNAPIYGRLNNIVRELSFGFTDAIKEKFNKIRI